MLVMKGMRFQIEVILVCIRWYAAYLSVKLPAPGRNDGGAWCICRSFYSEPLVDPVFTKIGEYFLLKLFSNNGRNRIAQLQAV